MVSLTAIPHYPSFKMPQTEHAFLSQSPQRFGNVEQRDSKPNQALTALLGTSGTSFWLGTYIHIPDPPIQARMQMSMETEMDNSLYINYLIWDDKDQRFMRQDVHYVASNGLWTTNEFQERGGYVQDVHDGELLYGGVIVDQMDKRLILPNGGYIDGPTGNIYAANGRLLKRFRAEKLPSPPQAQPLQIPPQGIPHQALQQLLLNSPQRAQAPIRPTQAPNTPQPVLAQPFQPQAYSPALRPPAYLNIEHA